MMRMMPRVVSSGSMEYFVDADISELARQASHCSLTSYCSLADLPEYSIDPHELHQLIEQCAVPSSLIVPRSGLGTVWEYVRGAPRRPDSATSNSLCSADEHDMQEVMAEDEVPAAAQVGWRGDVSPPTGITAAMATTIYNEPDIVYDDSIEMYNSPVMLSPKSVFQAGKWY